MPYRRYIGASHRFLSAQKSKYPAYYGHTAWFHTLKIIQQNTQKSAIKSVTQLCVMNQAEKNGDKSFIAFWLVAFILGYFLIDSSQREREIIRKRLRLSNEETQFIIPSTRLITIGKKPRGDLSGAIVRDQETGIEYLKKGAKNFDALVIEIIISNLLALLRPGVQPAARIAQEFKNENNSRFYSLSEKVSNAVDIEEFIRANADWEEKLKSKPVIGLDESLALDYILAKQRDMKLANYLIADQGSYYEIISIDHEFALTGSSPNCFFYGDDYCLNQMVTSVNDLRQPDEFNHAGLAGDSRAKKFFDITAPQMSLKKVVELYKKASSLDDQKMAALTSRLEKNGFLTSSECRYYQGCLHAIREKAEVASFEMLKKNYVDNRPHPVK